MDAATEPEPHHVEDPLTLPSGFLEVDMPFASFHDLLLRDSQLSLPWFDFSGTGNITSHPEAPGAREDTPCRNSQGSCLNSATGLLSSMYPGSYSCVLSMISHDGDHRLQPSRAADAILDLNRSALAVVHSILQCSCRRVPQVLLLTTAICSRIGASYRQIASMYSQRRKTSADNTVLSGSGNENETRRQDFFIGSHRLSQDVEAAVIRRVLLGMLRELEVVIGGIACHTDQPPGVNDPTSDMMLSRMRARMVEFLHTQAHALTSALDHLESDFGAAPSTFSHD